MHLTKMDLLNYQYLDKMNNNIGILCYEGTSVGVLKTFEWPLVSSWVNDVVALLFLC